MREIFEQKLTECPIVAIMRGVEPEQVIASCEAIASAGVKLMEITMNSPNAAHSIQIAAKHFKGSEVLIGAGTVLTPANVDAIADAGGKYIISPDTNPAVIRQTKKRGLLSIPGFMTPSEAFIALNAGADFLKCFPAGTLGPEYIKDLKAVIKVPIIATGGINAANAVEFLAVSAGLGIGSSLYKAGLSPKELATRAANIVERIS